jgi:hypothetical protein
MKARDNPFRTERILRVRYRMSGETLQDLLDRLRRRGYRGAIVGPKGTGKTTLLEDLAPALSAIGFNVVRLRLDDRNRTFPRGFLSRFLGELSKRDVILFDGAEQMSWLEWRRFKTRSKRAGGLVITSHSAGMLPTVKRCSTSADLLSEIVSELLGEKLPNLREMTGSLHQKHDGNLREALREMYDVAALTNE